MSKHLLSTYAYLNEAFVPLLTYILGCKGGISGKKPIANAGDVRDMGSIPGLGRSPEEGMATHSSILAWRLPMDRGAWGAAVHGVELDRLSN